MLEHHPIVRANREPWDILFGVTLILGAVISGFIWLIEILAA